MKLKTAYIKNAWRRIGTGMLILVGINMTAEALANNRGVIWLAVCNLMLLVGLDLRMQASFSRKVTVRLNVPGKEPIEIEGERE